jgi:hypothetical protein
MVRITLHAPLTLWRAFRAACVRRGTSASQEFMQFMRERLITWGEVVPDDDEITSDMLCLGERVNLEATTLPLTTAP